MTTPEERDHACAAFLEPQGMGYARQIEDDGQTRWLLCDSDGGPIVISSLDMIRTIASEAGLTLCSVH